METWLIWLIVVIALALIEIITINLVTIWFVISGIVSSIVSVYFDNFILEFAIFVIGGITLLITTKPLFTKYLKPKKEKTNIDRIIGMVGIVTEKINKDENGAIKIDGKVWTAFSDVTIEKDMKAKVLEIKGAKVKVEKVRDE